MKLEKREITLNEKDSLKDVCYTEKNLLLSYCQYLCMAERNQTREELLALIKETGEDMLFTRDLLLAREKEK